MFDVSLAPAMNARNTWLWFVLAAGLFAFIFFFERHLRQPAPGLPPLLPNFKAAAVTSVQVAPEGQREIRVERTNDAWSITRPTVFPADAMRVRMLLDALERIVPAAFVSAAELRQRPNAEAEFGL